MARKKINKQSFEPDPVYNNHLLNRLINRVMIDGKKQLARQLIYRAFERIKKEGKDPIEVFEKAIYNVGPRMEVRPRRIGGASYQVPREVRGERRLSLAIRWLVLEARKRPNKDFPTFDQKLAVELLDASCNKGQAVKRREMVQRMAEANKAFAHFRW